MNDEFRKRNRIESINSLKESIVNLKSSHATLEVTSQIFKESIAKEKEIFSRVLSMDTASTPESAVVAPTSVLSTDASFTQSVTPVLSNKSAPAINPVEVDVEDDSASIEGVMSTEKVAPLTSKQ